MRRNEERAQGRTRANEITKVWAKKKRKSRRKVTLNVYVQEKSAIELRTEQNKTSVQRSEENERD